MTETTKTDFAPIGDADWPAEIGDMRGGFAGGLNVYRTMAHHPDLLAGWGPLRDHVVVKNVLGRQRSEVVILRTGVRLGSDYEWAHHVSRGRACGMDDARIASLKGPVAAMAPQDAVLAGAVDELFDDKRLQPETLAALAALVGKTGVLDVIATVGFYSVLGFMLNSFDTPLDSAIAEEMARRPLREA